MCLAVLGVHKKACSAKHGQQRSKYVSLKVLLAKYVLGFLLAGCQDYALSGFYSQYHVGVRCFSFLRRFSGLRAFKQVYLDLQSTKQMDHVLLSLG